jgi:hypothetical protein
MGEVTRRKEPAGGLAAGQGPRRTHNERVRLLLRFPSGQRRLYGYHSLIRPPPAQLADDFR